MDTLLALDLARFASRPNSGAAALVAGAIVHSHADPTVEPGNVEPPPPPTLEPTRAPPKVTATPLPPGAPGATPAPWSPDMPPASDDEGGTSGQSDAAGDAYWNDGEGWDSIGNLGSPYIGTFDGNGHIISNLFIVRKQEYLGLFGVVIGTVKRVWAGGRPRIGKNVKFVHHG